MADLLYDEWGDLADNEPHHNRYQQRGGEFSNAPKHLWQDQAACRDSDAAIFFPEHDDRVNFTQARAICAGCPVLLQCADYAQGAEYGFFAGLSATQRRRQRTHTNKKEA